MSDLFGSIQALHGALDYHLERHNVLASNVAHVDTPGYRPHDLARVDLGSFGDALALAMRTTQPGHLKSAASDAAPLAGHVFEDLSSGVGADGNYVSLDREAAKLAANQLRYDVVSAIAAAELKQLQYAVNDGK